VYKELSLPADRGRSVMTAFHIAEISHAPHISDMVVPHAPREVLMYLGTVPPNTVLGHTPFIFETSLR
jgi:hypothetical protein